MIELIAPTSPGRSEARLVLRPRRVLTARQWLAVYAGLVSAMAAVALISYAQGNAFAPAFAVLDAGFIALALAWAWRRSARIEVISVDGRALEVRRSGTAGPVFSASPYWVRLSVADADGESRVWLGSSGRWVEVGDFLAPDERRRLARRLTGLLDAAAGRGPSEM